MADGTVNISSYLLQRLQSAGVDHVFGIPGDYVLPFLDELASSPLHHVASCNELNAGYAADGYARLRGLAAVAVTYGPGSLSLVNAVAGAYAERVPVVVVCGAPARDALRANPFLHHILPGREDASLRIFQHITADARLLADPAQAPAEIDAALAICRRERRPVYLEVPVDLQRHPCAAPGAWPASESGADPASIARALDALSARLAASHRCVLLVGHEVRAFGLEEQVLALLDHSGLPAASLFSGKPEFIEQHPRCIGIYQGLGSEPVVREFVDSADTVVWLGAVPSDFNRGGARDKPEAERTVCVFDGRVTVPGATHEGVPLAPVVLGLTERLPRDGWTRLEAPRHCFAHRATTPWEAVAGRALTNKRLYDRLAHFLAPGDIALADAGPAVNLAYVQFPRDSRYIASAYWAAIGSGFGFTLGACFAADSSHRIIAVEGDGSFQMTGQELSTMIRYGLCPVIIVVNNRGYTVERLIHDGPFNDIPDWRYHQLPEAFGGQRGLDIRTEDELEAALVQAARHSGPGPLLIEVHLDPLDVPEAFKRIGARLRGG